MSASTVYRQNSVLRPPDWRWLYAGELISRNTQPRRDAEAPDIWVIYRFRKDLETANTPVQRAGLIYKYPNLYDAWEIYNTTVNNTRWEIEARILARQTDEEISAKIGTVPGVIDKYERYFFNVRDKLDCPSYITHQVFGRSLHCGLAERDFDLLWKLWGYWNGPAVLDCVIYTTNNPSRPELGAGISAALEDDLRFSLTLKAAKTARIMPIRSKTAAKILELYLRLVAMEHDLRGTDKASESLFAGLAETLQSIQWEKFDWQTHKADIGKGGAGWRAWEMLSTDKDRTDALRIIDSVEYPKEAANGNTTIKT